MSGEKSTFQIRQNYLALVGFLPEPDFCRIWKKCRIPAGAGGRAEIRYSPNLQHLVPTLWLAWNWQITPTVVARVTTKNCPHLLPKGALRAVTLEPKFIETYSIPKPLNLESRNLTLSFISAGTLICIIAQHFHKRNIYIPTIHPSSTHSWGWLTTTRRHPTPLF